MKETGSYSHNGLAESCLEYFLQRETLLPVVVHVAGSYSTQGPVSTGVEERYTYKS